MVPKRSAIMPPSGWPMPHNRFCSPSARPKTSRPQWLALDIGVRKNPSVERGPNAISVTTQPKPMTSAGVRQPAIVDGAELVDGAEFVDGAGLSSFPIAVIVAPVPLELRKSRNIEAAN